ncbi:FAD-dependent monooxygenase [Candidatus Pelagibacter sp.]|nr:FAD-dependent monooxygenase [Candidatus Pelagibacter sp.]
MKICIIGDGLTSLTLAKALINKKVSVDILHSQKNKNYSHSRTLGISQNNIEYFNKNISDIKKIGWKIKDIKIFTDNLAKSEVIKFSEKNKQLFSILYNYKLYNQLIKELKKNKLFNYKKDMKYKNIIKKDYKLIINCDPNHEITKKFFFKKLEKKYNSYAHTTIIKHKKIKSNSIATQIFTKNGPIAFLPISSTNTSVVCSLRLNKNSEKISITSLIEKYNPKYEIKKIDNISCVELKFSILRKYYNKNILAFGDLLHRLHPLAGQGFNMTIRDIKELIKIIDSKIKLGLDIDQSICLDFENKMKHKNFIFSKGVDWIYEFFNFESKFDNVILSESIRFFGKNNSLNKVLKKFANFELQA